MSDVMEHPDLILVGVFIMVVMLWFLDIRNTAWEIVGFVWWAMVMTLTIVCLLMRDLGGKS